MRQEIQRGQSDSLVPGPLIKIDRCISIAPTGLAATVRVMGVPPYEVDVEVRCNHSLWIDQVPAVAREEITSVLGANWLEHIRDAIVDLLDHGGYSLILNFSSKRRNLVCRFEVPIGQSRLCVARLLESIRPKQFAGVAALLKNFQKFSFTTSSGTQWCGTIAAACLDTETEPGD
jgi:hypothetical protein